MDLGETYKRLVSLVRRASLLASCSSLLAWDEETYLPPGGIEHRANQLALLAGLHYQHASDPHIGELLSRLEQSELGRDAEAPASANLREIRRDYQRLTRVPRRLIEELTRVASLAQPEWSAARAAADFPRFRPWLERIVALKREEALALGFEGTSYDALLDEHEPGLTTGFLEDLFEALRRNLVPLLDSLRGRRDGARSGLRGPFAPEAQRLLSEAAARAVGFDFGRGRLDTSVHPFFTAIGPGDCRLTNRYAAHDLGEALVGTLHEVGHGLYEQGLDPEHFGTPLGEPASLGVHESQARLWENWVGRSRPFWKHFWPRVQEMFPTALGDMGLDDWYAAMNRVEPGTNRVRADEVSYNLHIMVRFELERALVAGDLAAADLPAAWNDACRRHLSVTPVNDAEGCLQDSHWSAGLIGYFPSYTLGNVFAAQLFEKAARDLGDLEGAFARGDFAGLLGWLREKVHRPGRRYPPARLIEQAAGAAPDPDALVCYLRQKYAS